MKNGGENEFVLKFIGKMKMARVCILFLFVQFLALWSNCWLRGSQRSRFWMHNHVALSLRSNCVPYPNALQNPRFSLSVWRRRGSCFYSGSKCSGIQIHSPPHQRLNSLGCVNGALEDERVVKSVGVKDIDVSTLGNLCVDIVLNVPKLPPKPMDERRAYMEELVKSPPDKVIAYTILFYYCFVYILQLLLLFFFLFDVSFNNDTHLKCLMQY